VNRLKTRFNSFDKTTYLSKVGVLGLMSLACLVLSFNVVPTSDNNTSVSIFSKKVSSLVDQYASFQQEQIQKNKIFEFNFAAKNLVSGTEKFVKTVATGVGDGSDWDNALGEASLKTAIESGGVVHIAAGSYFPGTVINTLNNVCVIGGYPSTATGTDICGYNPLVNYTYIDGADSHRLFTHTNNSVNALEFKGLILQNGLSGGGSAGGGSAFFTGVTMTTPINFKFIDLEIKNNNSTSHGAIYLGEKTNVNTEVLIKNCNFRFNDAYQGGAISLYNIRNSTSSSYANQGKLVIDDCVFLTNKGLSVGGGAINMEQSHQWTISNSNFCENNASPQNGELFTPIKVIFIFRIQFLIVIIVAPLNMVVLSMELLILALR